MKGSPEQPMCGFSARTVAALDALGAPYAAVDVLPDPRIRQELSAISNWPTIPQLFARGELVGGCDIVTEMYEAGELADALGVEAPQDAPAAGAGRRGRRARAAAAADREPALLADEDRTSARGPRPAGARRGRPGASAGRRPRRRPAAARARRRPGGSSRAVTPS